MRHPILTALAAALANIGDDSVTIPWPLATSIGTALISFGAIWYGFRSHGSRLRTIEEKADARTLELTALRGQVVTLEALPDDTSRGMK